MHFSGRWYGALFLVFVCESGCFLDSVGTDGGQGGDGAGAPGSGANDPSTGGQGGAGAGAGGGPDGGSGGAGSGEADCTNQQDDDDDALVDCDDPDCGSHECLPLHAGAIAYLAQLPGGDSCAGALEQAAYLDCEGGCDCAAVDGTCQIHWDAYGGGACSNYLGFADGPYPCFNNEPDGFRAFVAEAVPDQDPSCVAQPGPSFAGQLSDACTYSASSAAGSCASGGACIPKLPDNTKRCVLVAPEAACASPYVYAATVHTADSDATCSCDCNQGANSCSGGALEAFSGSDGCSGSALSIPLDGQCHEAGSTQSIRALGFAQTTTCDAESDKATPSAQHKVCCLP